MKDIFPDHVQTSKDEKESKFIVWFNRQNWFLWGGLTGVIIAIYRNLDRIMSWF